MFARPDTQNESEEEQLRKVLDPYHTDADVLARHRHVHRRLSAEVVIGKINLRDLSGGVAVCFAGLNFWRVCDEL